MTHDDLRSVSVLTTDCLPRTPDIWGVRTATLDKVATAIESGDLDGALAIARQGEAGEDALIDEDPIVSDGDLIARLMSMILGIVTGLVAHALAARTMGWYP